MSKRVMVAVAALLVSGCGGASPEAAAPADTIAVHGDWTIEVYDADGTLDEHIEFQNAFEGDVPLSYLLAGGYEVGGWMIRFRSPTSSPCDPTAALPCVITNSADVTGDHVSTDLAVTIETGTLVLSGSTTASADASISTVETAIDLAPTSGGFDRLFEQFTYTATEAYDVEAGQTVQVEVVISFTTG